MIIEPPTTSHLKRIYFELAKIGASSIGEKKSWPYKIKTNEELFSLACDMSRYDPRLFGILVLYLIEHWKKLNPLALRNLYKTMKCPQTFAVITEFLRENSTENEPLFFCEYLCAGLKPVPYQFFFYNIYSPGGSLAERAAQESLYEFKKWGFLAKEMPTIDLRQKTGAGLFDAASRKNILLRILRENKEVRLKDYLKAINYSVSRQQALLDIKNSGVANPVGRGRGAKWKVAA